MEEERNICRECVWHGYARNGEECHNIESPDYGHETDDNWSCEKYEGRPE